MGIKRIISGMFRALGYDLVRWNKALDDKFFVFNGFDIRTVVDIGANRGQFAGTALRYFPKAIVYSFEPLPDAFTGLREAARRDSRIRPFNLALSDSSGERRIYLHKDRDDASSFLKSTETYEKRYGDSRPQEEVVVKTVTLDEVGKSELKEVEEDILVKMDVQGFENKVITGGRNFLPRAALCVLEISLIPLYDGQASSKEIFLAMDELGFDYSGNLDQVRDREGRVVYLDALFIKRKKSST